MNNDDILDALADELDLDLLGELFAEQPETHNEIPRHSDNFGSLSFQQQRLWLQQQLTPESISYNVPRAYYIETALDLAKLQQALNTLVNTHQALATRFSDDNTPIQHLVDNAQVPLSLLALPESQQDWPAIEVLSSEVVTGWFAKPFDLSVAPLFRAAWVDYGKGGILLLDNHHIASDGWSANLILRDLARAYFGEQIVPTRLRYLDYAQWQRDALESEMGQQACDYWRNYVDFVPQQLNVPKAYSSEASRYARLAKTHLSAQLTQGLRSLCQQYNLTLSSLSMALYQVVLSRFSDAQQFLLGVPTAARNHPDISDIVGFFVNTQLYKNEAQPTRSLIDVARAVQQHTLAVIEHQLIPYEWLARELDWQQTGEQSHFQAMYNFSEYQPSNDGPMPLPLTPIVVDKFEAKFPLSLEVVELADTLLIQFEGEPKHYDEEVLTRLLESFLTLTKQLVAAPEQALGNVSLAVQQPQASKQQVTPISSYLSVLTEAFLSHPERIAATDVQGRELSYGALDKRSAQLANFLFAEGLQAEQTVALMFERGLDMLVAMLAVMRAGGTYVPVDPKLPQSRIDYILQHSETQWVLHNTEVLLPDDIRGIDTTQLYLERQMDSVPFRKIHPAQLAYVIYTSGSTGKPKGVAVSHHNLDNFLAAMQEKLALQSADTVLALTSLSFDISGLELHLPLYAGAQVCIAQQQSELNESILNEVSVIQATPAGWRALLADNLLKRPVLGLCGGEALPAELAQTLLEHQVRLWNMYGPTETTIWSSCQRVEKAKIHLGDTVRATQFYILDDALNPVPNEVSGELYIAGDGLARGYLNRPELSAERFVANPFCQQGSRLYRTGDLVKYNKSGQLEYLGRTDHQVKIRGFRIELGEIEAHLYQQLGVDEAVVIAEELPTGTRLVAYVAGNNLDGATLQSLLLQGLPSYMVPSVIVVLDKLPLNNSGKIDRHALPKVQDNQRGEFVAPANQLEQQLADIWQSVLKYSPIGRGDDFFTLGGDSIVALQLASRISEALQLNCSVKDIFDAPNVEALAVLLNTASKMQLPELNKVSAQSNYDLAPAQLSLWLSDQMVAEQDKHAFNISGAVTLRGALNIDLLQRAFELVIARHASLRMRFVEHLGEVSMAVDEQVEFKLISHNLSNLSQEQRTVQSQQLQSTFENQAFDLATAPLLRAMLVQLQTQEYQLSVSMHHIISDGWSTGVLIDDLGKAYQALVTQQSPHWQPLNIDYVDYAQWQHALQSGEAGQQLRDYWREHLDDAPANSALPNHYPRPAQLNNEGGLVVGSFDADQTKRLKAFASEQRISLNALLLSGYFLFLHAINDKPDMIVGSDFAGRDNPALEALIGFFVRVLPQRSILNEEALVIDFIKQTQDVSLQVMAHQALGLESLTELLDTPRVNNIQPLVQQLFVMQNTPQQQWPMTEISLEPLDSLSAISSKFDSALFVIEADELQCQWVFRKQLYNPEIMQQWLGRWQQCVLQLIEMSEQPVRNVISPMIQEFKTMQKAARGNSFSGLKKGLKKRAKAPAAPIKTYFLPETEQFPILVEPTSPDLDPINWASNNRDVIEGYLKQYGGIIFRNFALQSPQEFESFADAIQPGLYGQYGDLPKKEGGKKTYKSTPYPERQMILYHNESSHLGEWPRKQWFFCELPSKVGGATPIVDCRRMLKELPEELVAKIKEKELLYVRNFIPNLDVAWQDFYKTDDKAEVEARLTASNTEFRWLDNGGLQTRTKTHGVIKHHLSGEESFFNQVQLHHESCLEESVRNDLIEMVGHEYLPRNVFFGDGTPISYEEMTIIGEAYERCAVRFDWQKGDVVMLDNMLAAHARDPYEEPRKIVVAMGDMVSQQQLTEANEQQAKAEQECLA
ncbi:non-ribosomal peptide synthetase [Pseudoalteromonas umbrosa]|uniref:non-ribosomal peptide synthetase n=1 Tax=Pseudoalteromonas umbrosa TaxID=3048489 RepID=UPI0024C32FFD|nr:non-ribosomal peptide synthetase [Pseudoalteromonas sp. B95]MDK1290489.1 amino acid adenylation domain-containing protein [Pseudoalteromonas sp. B95]